MEHARASFCALRVQMVENALMKKSYIGLFLLTMLGIRLFSGPSTVVPPKNHSIVCVIYFDCMSSLYTLRIFVLPRKEQYSL